ncbi:MAG TPA: hypothetical protein VF102_10450 [Gemmatimonadaceae bacterium]
MSFRSLRRRRRRFPKRSDSPSERQRALPSSLQLSCSIDCSSSSYARGAHEQHGDDDLEAPHDLCDTPALVHTARVERRVGEEAETRDVEAHRGAANVGYANAVNG